MYGRTGLERFKKAQTLEPFAVASKPTTCTCKAVSHPTQLDPVGDIPAPQQQQVTQIGGGQSSWQPPDWAIEPRPGVYYLDVLKDGEVLDRTNLNKRKHVFGRQLHMCDFVLDHQSVSRQHAAVVPHKNGSVYVIDLGSAHGTFVANERLTKDSPVELEVGQSLRFAASTRVYILKKDNSALFPPLAAAVKLPPPPDPSDEEAVLAYNTFVNRYDLSESASERPAKRSKKTRVAFRDQVGGELVEVVGVSDGADVETEAGPMGVKEGSSLVGKYESLVQTTVIPIPKGKESNANNDSVSVSPNAKGVTDKLQQILNRVKAPPPLKGGIYDGESLSSKVGSSWAYTKDDNDGQSSVIPKTNIMNNDDDDLFG